MRLAPTLALTLALGVLPAGAQQATTPGTPGAPAVDIPEASEISATADRDFWCAIAFSFTARAAEITGDDSTALEDATKSQALFASLVSTMKAGGFIEEQFNAIASIYTARVMNPFRPADDAGFPEDVCETASVEAEAVLEALTTNQAEEALPETPPEPAPEEPAATPE